VDPGVPVDAPIGPTRSPESDADPWFPAGRSRRAPRRLADRRGVSAGVSERIATAGSAAGMVEPTGVVAGEVSTVELAGSTVDGRRGTARTRCVAGDGTIAARTPCSTVISAMPALRSPITPVRSLTVP